MIKAYRRISFACFACKAGMTMSPAPLHRYTLEKSEWHWGLPRWHSGKESACQWRRHKRHRFNPWVRKIPWNRKWQPTPVFFPGKFHRQRSLVSYSPWGCKESDTAEWLSMLTHTHTHTHTHQSVSQFSCSVVSNSLRPLGLQCARPPCPSPTPGAYSNSCPSSQWCHPTISSSVAPFSSCLQSFPASGFFLVSQHTHTHTHTNMVPGTGLKPTSALPLHLSQKSPEWVTLTTFYWCGNWESESWSDSSHPTRKKQHQVPRQVCLILEPTRLITEPPSLAEKLCSWVSQQPVWHEACHLHFLNSSDTWKRLFSSQTLFL